MISDLFPVSTSVALQYAFHSEYLTGWLRTMEITFRSEHVNSLAWFGITDLCLAEEYE